MTNAPFMISSAVLPWFANAKRVGFNRLPLFFLFCPYWGSYYFCPQNPLDGRVWALRHRSYFRLCSTSPLLLSPFLISQRVSPQPKNFLHGTRTDESRSHRILSCIGGILASARCQYSLWNRHRSDPPLYRSNRTEQIGKERYGKIRLFGSIGFIAVALVLVRYLTSAPIGIMFLIAMAIATLIFGAMIGWREGKTLQTSATALKSPAVSQSNRIFRCGLDFSSCR